MTKITTTLDNDNSEFLAKYSEDYGLTQKEVINKALNEFKEKRASRYIEIEVPLPKDLLDKTFEYCIKYNTSIIQLFVTFCNDINWKNSLIRQKITVPKDSMNKLPNWPSVELFCFYLSSILKIK